jgi:hypothetical protein
MGSICHLCTYQALEGLHQEQEKSSPSFCLYGFEESVHDHFHQEGLSQFELPDVLAYKPEKDNISKHQQPLNWTEKKNNNYVR